MTSELLLNYGTINNDTTIEHETQLQLSNNRGIVGSGVFCGCAPLVTSCNSGGTVEGGVLCWVHAEAVSGESEHS
jgi:hypothetical protein